MEFLDKAKNLLSDAKVYWRTPLKGRYMPFKEIAAYIFGGIGVYCIIYMSYTMIISGTNVVMTNLTGIPPKYLLIIYYICTIAGIPFTALRAHMIDNMRLKAGKYRPWILGMGIPSVVIMLAMLFTPYQSMSKAAAYIITTVYSLALNFVYNFFYEAYENLVFLLSPNTQERADVSSVKSITYSLAPTVLNPLLPLMSKLLNTGDMYDVRIYKVMFPIISVIGIALSIVVFANTKEKIIQAKTHVIQIGFFEAIKAVAKNKYFWIISLAGWIGFLENSQSYILGWLYNYGKLCTDGQYSLITIIYGNASLWGMLAAPFAIRRWGKKAVLVVTNLFNILFIALMFPSVGIRSIWLVLVCLWMNALMGSFAHILTPAINADIRDYQQYMTGERIDGMFSAISLITSFITMATSTFIPLIFDRFGINEHNGYANAYDILKYQPDTLYSLIHLLILLSVIGATLNVLPYFFYDLSETKQRAMVNILKIRAMFEDFGNDALKDRELIEGVDVLRAAMADSGKEPVAVDSSLKRKERRAAREANENITIAKMVLAEYDKFSSEEFTFKLAHARKTVAAGVEGILEADKSMVAEAKAMPAGNETEKAIRKYCIEFAKQSLRSKKTVVKHYNGTMPEFNADIFETLFEEENKNDEAKQAAYAKLDAAKASKDSAQIAAMKNEIKALTNEGYVIKGKIKQATRDNTKYNHAIKPYADAQKLIKQSENYGRFVEIEELYEAATERVATEDAAAKAQAEKEALERKLDKERRIAEKKAAKSRK